MKQHDKENEELNETLKKIVKIIDNGNNTTESFREQVFAIRKMYYELKKQTTPK